MKGFTLLSILLLSFSAWSNDYKTECASTVVTVDEIVKNSHIKGHVTGLPSEAFEHFKVVFYVKTNVWYVHPYTWHENQEEGYSYSNLSANGEFWVRTVRRDVPSEKLAVVVVPKNYRISSQKWWLKPLFGRFGGVLKDQCSHVIVPGNGDFFL
jgi:hypothetical protein